jgi:hypothetical protein
MLRCGERDCRSVQVERPRIPAPITTIGELSLFEVSEEGTVWALATEPIVEVDMSVWKRWTDAGSVAAEFCDLHRELYKGLVLMQL